jgi:hypothetical protein
MIGTDQAIHIRASYQYQGDQFTTFNPYKTKITNGQLVTDGLSATYARIPEQNNVSASISYDIGRIEIGLFGNNLVNGVKYVDVARATYYKVYQPGDRIAWARPAPSACARAIRSDLFPGSNRRGGKHTLSAPLCLARADALSLQHAPPAPPARGRSEQR